MLPKRSLQCQNADPHLPSVHPRPLSMQAAFSGSQRAYHPRCAIFICMGKSDPGNPDRHRQQSMVLVPRDTPGVRVLRPIPVRVRNRR